MRHLQTGLPIKGGNILSNFYHIFTFSELMSEFLAACKEAEQDISRQVLCLEMFALSYGKSELNCDYQGKKENVMDFFTWAFT